MRPRSSCTTIALLIGIGFGALPALARDRVELVSEWHVTPEATRAHPKKLQVALVATEATDIVACRLQGRLDRNWWDDEAEPPILAVGGKMIATLKIVKASRTLKVGKQTQTAGNMVSDWPWDRSANVGWTDGSAYVCEGCPSNLKYKRTAKLPVRVEPGDMVVWALKFKGMAPLQVEPLAQPPYADEIRFYAKCQSCGSVGYPCPDPW